MNIIKNIDKNIFREYDIRGAYNVNINEDVSYTIGKSFGTYIKKYNKNVVMVGYDNRLSSISLTKSLITGLLSTGVDVVLLGLVTTPMFYYAKIFKNITPGIMVTASHNPKDDNGFKISLDKKSNAKGEEITDFMNFTLNGEFDEGSGNLYKYDIKDEYIKLFKDNLNFGNRRLKVVIDPGNGTTSIIAKELFKEFPIELISIYDESDGTFPNHHPDPVVEENLVELKKKVIEVKADIGIGFDGDGDRAGFVDEKGELITSDEYAVIVLKELLKNNSNKKIIYDVKCSNIIKEEVSKLGGEAIEYKTGASYTMSKVIEEGILFGVEYSGHIYFNNSFPPITSGIYSGLKLVEIMSNNDLKLSEMLNGVNKYYSTLEIKVPSKDDAKRGVVNKVLEYSVNKGYKVNDIDGVKVYFDDGWALIRCSNTGPNITLRFEAISEERLNDIKEEFTNIVNEYNK